MEIPNLINRCSNGDRARGLVTESDGSMTLHLRSHSPGPDWENNWLPTPQQGVWFVAPCMYPPRPAAVDACRQCPPINRVR
ncbi:DUF1214 domain-containing protein [Streptomyces palmae]|uniref:DUF1214 domain-containing protein n=1 Tax=Streptomyces palmae TaxID=1701085 RepID=A0A4Z0HAH6_9ACTN|nr:DUF1214 domain-containing protein [Streptomyces palmae]TGB13270.1 DUF1214 domain-containing protein [Streptomyces palmae]